MTDIHRLLRLLRPLVFSLWCAFFIYLLAGHRYMAFLRPEFGLLIIIGLIIAAAFLFTTLREKHIHQGNELATLFRLLPLIVPMMYALAIAPGTILGQQAFNTRFTGSRLPSQYTPGSYAGPTHYLSPGQRQWLSDARKEGKEEIKNPKGEQTILELLTNADQYIGKRVSFTGMLVHENTIKEMLGGRDTAVYRFLVTCCVADATPLTVALDAPVDTAPFAADQWVKVEGIFHLEKDRDSFIAVVSKATLSKSQKPKMPYLF